MVYFAVASSALGLEARFGQVDVSIYFYMLWNENSISKAYDFFFRVIEITAHLLKLNWKRESMCWMLAVEVVPGLWLVLVGFILLKQLVEK